MKRVEAHVSFAVNLWVELALSSPSLPYKLSTETSVKV